MVLLFLSLIFSQNAGFGLTFGNTPKQISQLGNVLELVNCRGVVCVYSCKPVRTISWGNTYTLYFGNDSLGKVEVTSKNFFFDDFGTKGITTFLKIDTLLASKYIAEETSSRVTTNCNQDNFYKNLKKYGSTDWKKYYTGDDKYITLELIPTKFIFWGGFVKLSFERTPGWSQYENMVPEKDSVKLNDLNSLQVVSERNSSLTSF